jgi:hypothetical protein
MPLNRRGVRAGARESFAPASTPRPKRARGHPCDRDRCGRKHAEQHELCACRRCEVRQPPDDEEQPHSECREMKDTGCVAGRGMVRALLVLVAEAVELRDEDPRWQREEKEC